MDSVHVAVAAQWNSPTLLNTALLLMILILYSGFELQWARSHPSESPLLKAKVEL